MNENASFRSNDRRIPEHAEAAARILTHAAKRIREGENVRDVCLPLIDIVTALSGRI